MDSYKQTRREMTALFALGSLCRTPSHAVAQSRTESPALVQPVEKTREAYLARARALRDQAVREGDQGYGAVVVRDGTVVGEGRNYCAKQLCIGRESAAIASALIPLAETWSRVDVPSVAPWMSVGDFTSDA
jgi:hypothetical protein